jgi:hypothetical protein
MIVSLIVNIKRHRKLRFPATMLLLTALVSFFPPSTGLVQARALPTNQLISQAAGQLAERVAHHMAIPLDATQEVVWTPPHSKFRFKYITEVAVRTQIDGINYYFRLLQRGRSLSSIDVEQIPSNDIKSVSDSEFVQGGIHIYGQPEKRIVTTTAVVTLNARHAAVAAIRYNTGKMVRVPVGDTRAFNASAMVGAEIAGV